MTPPNGIDQIQLKTQKRNSIKDSLYFGRYQFQKDKIWLQTHLELFFSINYVVIYKAILVYYLNKITWFIKKNHVTKLHIDGLFNFHIMGWSKIAPN